MGDFNRSLSVSPNLSSSPLERQRSSDSIDLYGSRVVLDNSTSDILNNNRVDLLCSDNLSNPGIGRSIDNLTQPSLIPLPKENKPRGLKLQLKDRSKLEDYTVPIDLHTPTVTEDYTLPVSPPPKPSRKQTPTSPNGRPSPQSSPAECPYIDMASLQVGC